MVMADSRRLNDEELEKLLAEAARHPPPLPEGLLERVLADAGALADAAAGGRPAPAPAPAARPRRLAACAGWLTALGGWPALAGLSAAALVGLWLGYAPPQAVERLAGARPGNEGGFDPGEFMLSFEGVFEGILEEGREEG